MPEPCARRLSLRALLGLAPLLRIRLAGAADQAPSTLNWPTRPIRLIVPFPPGGPVDLVGRSLGQKLSETLAQPVLVDNRPGAGGIVGAEIAARSAPDGYTVFVCAIHHAVRPSLGAKLSYDIEKDFEPVSFAASFPIILVVNPALPVRSIKELIEYARARPGQLAFASAGNGGGTHLAGELFASMAGIDLLHVPYKGSAPAMADVLSNQVPMMFADAPTALPQIRAGKVRALGVASPQRSALAPELPTIAQSGLAGYEAYSWAGLVVPAGTPAGIIARLQTAVGRALTDGEIKARLAQAGAEAAPGSPAQFAALLHAEIAKWGATVQARNIQPD
jgi:tripartite-type tricarboxylate transporter receptor subunit TctC